MKQVRAAARAIVDAQAPVLYVGGGVIRGGATEDLSALVEATNAPVVTTLTRAVPSPTPTATTSACPACTARLPPSVPCSAPT